MFKKHYSSNNFFNFYCEFFTLRTGFLIYNLIYFRKAKVYSAAFT